MNANDIVTIITTVGFPIVACGGMAWYVKYITDKNREEMNAERAQHNEEMTKVTEALNNNTLAIQKLTDYIERG
jgi:hypothetical protein